MFIRESESEHKIAPKTEVEKKSLHVMFHFSGSSENWSTIVGFKDTSEEREIKQNIKQGSEKSYKMLSVGLTNNASNLPCNMFPGSNKQI